MCENVNRTNFNEMGSSDFFGFAIDAPLPLGKSLVAGETLRRDLRMCFFNIAEVTLHVSKRNLRS